MKLAELVIQLSANTASLKKDFEQAKSQAAEFASSMKSVLAGIGVGISVTGIAEAIRGLVEFEHSMSDAAAATGMTVEQISGFSFALKSTGVPLNELQLGLAQFDKIISGLMRSKAGASAITALGLSMQKLRTEGAHQALLDVADAFKKIPDGSAKAGIAAALFTATLGQKLIPILDRGRAGILAMEEEAKRLGVVLTDQEAQAADQTYQAFIQLEGAMRGMEIEAGTHLFPILIQLSEAFVGDADALESLKIGITETGLEVAKLATPLTMFTNIFGGAIRKKIDNEITQLETDREVALNQLQNQMKALTIPGVAHGTGELHLPKIYGLNHAKGSIDKVTESIRQLNAELTGLTQGDAERTIEHLQQIGASPAQIAQANAILNQIAVTNEQQAAIRQLAEANKDYDQLVDALSDSVIHLDAAQNDYIKTVAQLNLLESQGVNIDEGLTLAREKYRQALLAQIKTPAEAGYGKAEAQNASSSPFPGVAALPGAPQLTIMQKMAPLAKELGKTLSSAFEGMVISGKGFNQMLLRMTTLFAEFLMKAIVFKELANVFGAATGNSGGQSQSGGATGGKGGGIGSVLGSLFSGLAGSLAGGRASGGPVTAGQLYMVGENGPELFAPGMSGSIIPNGGSAQRSSSTNVNIDARGADAGVEQRIYRAMQVMQKQNVGQSLVVNYEYQARGGTL